MRSYCILLASLSLLACSSDDDEPVEDTQEEISETEETEETVDALLDLSGTWSGTCTLPESDFGERVDLTMELESSQEYGTYIDVDGRLLTGTGSASVTYQGSDHEWETRIDGVSGEDMVFLVAHEPTDHWLLEIDGSATEDSVDGFCGAAAWSFELEDFVYVWGDLSMTRD